MLTDKKYKKAGAMGGKKDVFWQNILIKSKQEDHQTLRVWICFNYNDLNQADLFEYLCTCC